MDGAINLMKPPGMSSSDCVVWLRHRLRGIKCGHGGTLDPAAAGVLPVLIGRGTKLFDLMLTHEKEYTAILRLGVTTDTLDAEGEITAVTDFIPDLAALKKAAQGLTGTISQLPPLYSAVKIGGRRACDIARRGGEVDMPSRQVTISALDVMPTMLENEYRLRVVCSAGTYIRSLGAELAAQAGSLGCLTALVRTRSGQFDIGNSYTVEELKALEAAGELPNAIIPLEKLLGGYPAVRVKPSALKRALNGAYLEADDMETEPYEGLIRLCTPDGELISLSENTGGSIKPGIML